MRDVYAEYRQGKISWEEAYFIARLKCSVPTIGAKNAFFNCVTEKKKKKK